MVDAAVRSVLRETLFRYELVLRINVVAHDLLDLAGTPEAAPPDPEAAPQRTAELVADLAEPAKADALDKLGEGRPAFDIANAWLREKLAPAILGEADPRSRS